MAENALEKVRIIFAGISAGDVELATKYIDKERFLQHNPYAADGVEGLANFIRQAPREQLRLHVVRALEDGDYVVTQARGQRSGRNIFFDVFRFEDGLVVEHWAFSTMDAPPNESGHTQLDGPTEPSNGAETEANKALLRRYYETFHLRGDHKNTDQWIAGDLMIRHEPGVRDGVGRFLSDVEVLMQHRTINEIKLLLGQGDLVFIAAQGTHEGKTCVYIDLYRAQGGKVVEHWGFPEMVPAGSESKNANGML